MGCDIFWDAREPDLYNQRKAAMWVEAFALHQGLTCRTYDKEVEGYFLDLNNLQPVEHPTKLGLFGATIPMAEEKKIRISSNLLGGYDVSFVFDNTPRRPSQSHHLITFERVIDLAHPYYSSIAPYFKTDGGTKKVMHACYRRGGYIRLPTDSADWLLTFLHVLKQECLSSLDVGDDYLIFEEIEKSKTALSRFKKKVIVPPEIRKKWAICD
jgi:hypothetical protein